MYWQTHDAIRPFLVSSVHRHAAPWASWDQVLEQPRSPGLGAPL